MGTPAVTRVDWWSKEQAHKYFGSDLLTSPVAEAGMGPRTASVIAYATRRRMVLDLHSSKNVLVDSFADACPLSSAVNSHSRAYPS